VSGLTRSSKGTRVLDTARAVRDQGGTWQFGDTRLDRLLLWAAYGHTPHRGQHWVHWARKCCLPNPAKSLRYSLGSAACGHK